MLVVTCEYCARDTQALREVGRLSITIKVTEPFRVSDAVPLQFL
jgi:hypothetical protein